MSRIWRMIGTEGFWSGKPELSSSSSDPIENLSGFFTEGSSVDWTERRMIVKTLAESRQRIERGRWNDGNYRDEAVA